MRIFFLGSEHSWHSIVPESAFSDHSWHSNVPESAFSDHSWQSNASESAFFFSDHSWRPHYTSVKTTLRNGQGQNQAW
jgi:hypothetical protein